MKIIVTALLLIALAGCAWTTEGTKKQLVSITPDAAKENVAIKDGPLDTIAVLDTSKVFEDSPTLSLNPYHAFLQAFIIKATGKTSFQLYQTISYDKNWRFYNSATYLHPTFGAKDATVRVLNRSVDSCQSSRCQYTEVVAFDVDESAIRALAAQYDPTQPLAWKYKFSANNGPDFEYGIMTAEIAGLVAAVDDYKRVHHMGQSANPGTHVRTPSAGT